MGEGGIEAFLEFLIYESPPFDKQRSNKHRLL